MTLKKNQHFRVRFWGGGGGGGVNKKSTLCMLS